MKEYKMFVFIMIGLTLLTSSITSYAKTPNSNSTNSKLMEFNKRRKERLNPKEKETRTETKHNFNEEESCSDTEKNDEHKECWKCHGLKVCVFCWGYTKVRTIRLNRTGYEDCPFCANGLCRVCAGKGYLTY